MNINRSCVYWIVGLFHSVCKTRLLYLGARSDIRAVSPTR